CFRCRDRTQQSFYTAATPSPVTGIVDLRSSLGLGTSDLDDWSPAARVWVGRYRLTQQQLVTHGVKFHEDSAYGPVVSFPCTSGGLSVRTFAPGSLTKSLTFGSGVFVASSMAPQGATLVIVEDALSAIRAAHAVSGAAIALLGSSLKPEAVRAVLDAVAPSGDTVVWLDNNNPTIKLAALRIALRLRALLATPVYINLASSDPKNYSDEEIREGVDASSGAVAGGSAVRLAWMTQQARLLRMSESVRHPRLVHDEAGSAGRGYSAATRGYSDEVSIAPQGANTTATPQGAATADTISGCTALESKQAPRNRLAEEYVK
ncbi:MAG: hypothetical protein ACREYE_23630, partial [Gammaproteobacteria bacterium]